MVPDADLLDGTAVVTASTAAFFANVPVALLYKWEQIGTWPPHVAERFGLRFYALSDVHAAIRGRNPDPRCDSSDPRVILDHRSASRPGGNPDQARDDDQGAPASATVSGEHVPSPASDEAGALDRA